MFPVAENNASLESRSGSGSIRSKLRRSGTRICQVFYSFMSSFPLPPKTRQTKQKNSTYTHYGRLEPLSLDLCAGRCPTLWVNHTYIGVVGRQLPCFPSVGNRLCRCLCSSKHPLPIYLPMPCGMPCGRVEQRKVSLGP